MHIFVVRRSQCDVSKACFNKFIGEWLPMHKYSVGHICLMHEADIVLLRRLLKNIEREVATRYSLPVGWLPCLGKISQKAFQANKAQYWQFFTDALEFVESHKIKNLFHYIVATDGQSVSLTFQKAARGAKRVDLMEEQAGKQCDPTAAPPSDSSWVKGPPGCSVPVDSLCHGYNPLIILIFNITHALHAHWLNQAARFCNYALRSLPPTLDSVPPPYTTPALCHTNRLTRAACSGAGIPLWLGVCPGGKRRVDTGMFVSKQQPG